MAKGVLVSYAGYPFALSSLFPDNGLASLAAVLRSEGHDCQVLDYNTPETMDRLVDDSDRERLRRIESRMDAAPDSEIVRELSEISARIDAAGWRVADEIGAELVQLCRRERVDFVGFKLWSGDGFDASKRIAESTRARIPDVRLFAGGPAVHYSGHCVALEAPVFDAVIDGDGEQAILDLAAFVEGKKRRDQVHNLVTAPAVHPLPDSQLQRLDCLPAPDYSPDAYPSMAGDEKLKVFCIDESRGCPMRCAFCINWRIQGGRWRTRSPQKIAAQISENVTRHRSRAFRLSGTYTPPRLLHAICEQIVATGLRVKFGLYLHSQGLEQASLALLVRAGCSGVFIGAESGSEHILKQVMNKRLRISQLADVVRSCQDANLFTAVSFIVPAPRESPESAAQTRQLMQRLFAGRSSGSALVNFPGLLPRTTWWQDRPKFGFDLQVSEDEYCRLLLRYKIRHIIPPMLWEGLPYALDGRDYLQMVAATSALRAWLATQGIVVNLADHDAMVAAAVGWSPSEAQRRLRELIFCGDSDGLRRLVKEANEAFAT